MNIFKGKRKYAWLAAAITASILGGYSAAAVESPVTEFHTTLTGDTSTDTEYKGNIDENGKYFFTKDSTITNATSAISASKDASIVADKTLNLKNAGAVKPEVPTVKEYTTTLTGFNLIDKAYADVFKDGVYKFTEDSKITNQYGMDIIENAKLMQQAKL